jgi:hypothetical protein
MVYTQMLFALTFDKLVFGTTPGFLSILGSSLILGSAIYVAMHKEPAKKADADDRGPATREEESGLMSPGMMEEDVGSGDGGYDNIQLERIRSQAGR